MNLEELRGEAKYLNIVSTARTNNYRYENDKERTVKLDVLRIFPRDANFNLTNNDEIKKFIEENDLVCLGIERNGILVVTKNSNVDGIKELQPLDYDSDKIDLN